MDTLMDTPMVTLWRGERVDQMTHAELLTAFGELGELYLLAIKPRPLDRLLADYIVEKHGRA